jgi:hypothetical protein
MALSINWATGVITVPKADLTLVTGTLYTLDTQAFRLELKALESSVYGICNLKNQKHSTQVTVGGITYARAVEILPPYSVEFEDGQYSVRLEGSNNNIWDVEAGILVQNQVQVIPTNAAGLITRDDMTDVRKANLNKVTRSGDIITIYEDDGSTVWKQFDLTNDERIEI